jgi:membrane AbrB-like protein
MSPIASLRPRIIRCAVAFVMAAVAALAFEQVRIPIPWMLGPLISMAVANLLGYFTPTVLAALVEQSWVIVLGGVLVMAVAAVGGRLLARVSGIDQTTCFFATVPGGAAEMSVLAGRYGGVVPAVAIAQSIRVVMLVIIVPAVVTYSGVAVGAREPPLALPFAMGPFAIMIAISITAGFFFQKLKLQNPWMMGPLLVTAAFAVFESDLSAIPRWISNLSQLMLGMALGTRFEREFFLRYRLFIPIALLNGSYIILASATVAVVVTWLSGIPLATALTGCGPGGIAEMTITAKALSLGVASVTAFQLVRIVLANFGAAYVLRLAVGNVKPVSTGPKF